MKAPYNLCEVCVPPINLLGLLLGFTGNDLIFRYHCGLRPKTVHHTCIRGQPQLFSGFCMLKETARSECLRLVIDEKTENQLASQSVHNFKKAILC